MSCLPDGPETPDTQKSVSIMTTIQTLKSHDLPLPDVITACKELGNVQNQGAPLIPTFFY